IIYIVSKGCHYCSNGILLKRFILCPDETHVDQRSERDMPGARKIIKGALLAILCLMLVLVIAQWELVKYGVQQGKGQMHIILNANPVEEYLQSPACTDS